MQSRNSEIADIFFKEGKCYEMLAMQWDQFLEHQSTLDFNRKTSVADFNLITSMTEYIKENIHQPITVNMLGKEFGTNEKKIQSLFKMTHQTTLNNYLQSYRLEQAIRLLKNKENNISDVVYAIGLKNKSYFSKIFKNKFGVTPSEFVKQSRMEVGS